MDPYLEAPVFWQGLQLSLIVCITRALNFDLPCEFAATINERILEPDATNPDLPERERFIQVVTTGDEKRVVAVIEVLSPANKSTRAGRREYVNKQQSILQSDTHLLEIDLLRAGEFTVAVPEGAVREQTGASDYIFSLHRGGEYDHFQYWSKTMRDPLPRRLLVPLTEGVPDVLLDLQTAFDEAYDAGPYARQVNYATDPTAPLRPDDALWANVLLQERGLRPAS